MTPISYRIHGHAVCPACFDDAYFLASDGLAYPWPARGTAVDVQPMYAGTSDAAGPCAGCHRPLMTPPATDPRNLHDPDDSAPFRPDDGPTRLALAAARLRDAGVALRCCLAHGDLADDPRRDAFQDLAARLDATPDPCAPQLHAPGAHRPAA